MNREPHLLGLFASLVLAAACASGGTTTTSTMREEAHPDSVEPTLPRRSCTAANTAKAPADGRVAGFSAAPTDGTGATAGGIPVTVVTSVPPDAVPVPRLTHADRDGRLTIEVHAVPGAKPQVLVTSLAFDGCIDATGFSGVAFRLSGSLSGCSLTYASVDPEHQYYRSGGPYPPQERISTAELTSEPRAITASFASPGSPGNPATPTDPSKLLLLQWLVIVPVGSDGGEPVPPCTGTLHVDDLRLYR